MVRQSTGNGVTIPPINLQWWLRDDADGIGTETHIRYIYREAYGGFLKWGYPKNGGFIRIIREHPTKMDDLGVPLV